MRLSAATRKRLYREGKQLLGPDRMARLRARALSTARRGRALEGGALRLGERLRATPRAHTRALVSVDAEHVLLSGRLDTGPAVDAATRVLLLDRDGREHDVTAALHRYTDRRASRSGSTASGFVLLHRLENGALPVSMTLRRDDGRQHTNTLPAPEHAPDALGRVIRLLALLADCAAGQRALLDAALGPAIERAWDTRERFARLDARALDASAAVEPANAATRVDHNPELATNSPRVSVIVPLYGRHDFLAHQLVHFVSDPEMRAAEILYVIDDPRLQSAVRDDADALARLHDIAFSVVYLPRNLGYAGANNAAATLARGEFVLLLNSDVLPAAPGWLGRMLAVADAGAGERLVGARLLYDDDSVQHDGMRFEAAANFEGLWINRHPGKGLPRDLFAAPAEAPAREAVTGACLLIRRQRYIDLGGLDEGYVLGDFEDSDLCLKARRAGLDIRLAPRAELYHLERQSQSLVTGARWKRDLTHYNCWRHNRRWHDDIVALQAKGGGVS